MEPPFRGEGLLVSCLSGERQLDKLEVAGAEPAVPTNGASSSGRAEVLQASDGSSILSAPTMAPGSVG